MTVIVCILHASDSSDSSQTFAMTMAHLGAITCRRVKLPCRKNGLCQRDERSLDGFNSLVASLNPRLEAKDRMCKQGQFISGAE